jgi:hypothetical protein
VTRSACDLDPVGISHPLRPLARREKRSARRTGDTAMSPDHPAWVMTAEAAIAIDAMPYCVYKNARRRESNCDARRHRAALGALAQAAVPTGAVRQSREPAAGLPETRRRSPRGFCSMAKP